VANKVHLEYLRRKPPPVQPEPQTEYADSELEYRCLDRCVEKLTAEHRELVLSYYQEQKHAKIEHRKALASKLGIAVNALRIRAHRIRLTLQECVKQCLQDAAV
jgi:DNA-directed RNA polymerase specialized sigma24 family protein